MSYKDMTFCTRKGCKYTHCHRHYSNIPWDELPEYVGVSVGDMYGSEVHCKLLLTEPPFNFPVKKGKKDAENA